MKNNFIRNAAKSLSMTPFHPQWFVFREQKRTLRRIIHLLYGTVLDIGCADCYLENYLNKENLYIGLDYLKTTSEMYHTTPTIYGNAHFLPIKDSSIDCIALLDVIEHLSEPEKCLREVKRTLKPGGKLFLQVPFIYPIHDAPYDYYRWTYYGLIELTKKYDLKVELSYLQGTIPKTFALITNIGLAKITSDLINFTNIFILIIPFVSIMIFLTNILGLLLSLVCNNNSFMPFGYLLICRKK